MSLVGPRPLPLRDYERLEAWHRGRYRVLPGITGLWQVSGRSALGFDDLVRLDFYYVENWSIWLDIEIIARTPAGRPARSRGVLDGAAGSSQFAHETGTRGPQPGPGRAVSSTRANA